MVRGVHKKIIEVADTQNEFFERAILIVKEGFREEDPERLRQKAGDYVSHMGNVALARRKKGKIFAELGKSFSWRGGWSGFYADCDFLAVIAKR